MDDRHQQLEALEREIAEIQSSLPAHSIPPAMLLRLEELEDQLQTLQRKDRDASA